ncbi:MAG: restriction endonuclease [Nitrosospira sp.]|nr:restriction endonuclease [Nitrosospira sp.]
MGWAIVAGIVVVIWIAVGVHGHYAGKSAKIVEDAYNSGLRRNLEKDRRDLDQAINHTNKEIEQRLDRLHNMEKAFKAGIISGREWLAKMISESDKAADNSRSNFLRYKKRPAKKAAQEVSRALAEKRKYKEQAKFLEYQLLSYEEYFPELEEYREAILDESVEFSDSIAVLDSIDPVLKYLDKREYEQLNSAQRNQLALDRYLLKHHSQQVVGRQYERYLGYIHEKNGWQVDYYGIHKGLEDLGRDLICSKDGVTRIIQAKCWSRYKTIREKHIFQLFGTSQLFKIKQDKGFFNDQVQAIFVTSTCLSEEARDFAKGLNVHVMENRPLKKNYPMIKCNINKSTKEKIYHLPFDQQYDKTKIDPDSGECYAQSAEEAEQLGFRRARRYFYNKN